MEIGKGNNSGPPPGKVLGLLWGGPYILGDTAGILGCSGDLGGDEEIP